MIFFSLYILINATVTNRIFNIWIQHTCVCVCELTVLFLFQVVVDSHHIPRKEQTTDWHPVLSHVLNISGSHAAIINATQVTAVGDANGLLQHRWPGRDTACPRKQTAISFLQTATSFSLVFWGSWTFQTVPLDSLLSKWTLALHLSYSRWNRKLHLVTVHCICTWKKKDCIDESSSNILKIRQNTTSDSQTNEMLTWRYVLQKDTTTCSK